MRKPPEVKSKPQESTGRFELLGWSYLHHLRGVSDGLLVCVRECLGQVTCPSCPWSAAPRNPATRLCVKKDPWRDSASWASSMPELEERSTVPSLSRSGETMAKGSVE